MQHKPIRFPSIDSKSAPQRMIRLEVQRVCNTAFEFNFRDYTHLDKKPISPEVTDLGIAHDQQIRIGRFLDWGRI